MKSWIKKIRLAALAIFLVVFLAGCSAGSTVDTNLTINQDLSGVRTMDIAIDSAVFAENFHGDLAALNGVMEQNCPAQLTWKYENRDGVDHYLVELSFSSPEDYKMKVEAITGEEETLELSAPDTIWANGFRIYEDFSSSDLLDWLKEGVVEAQLVDESNKSNVFQDGSSKVLFNGETFDSYNSIQVNELEYLPLDKIDVKTNIKDKDSFDRSIIFYIPKESISIKKAEIEAFLNGNVPDGAASEWGTYESGTTMTITKENMDLAGLNLYNQKVLASEKNLVEVTAKTDDTNTFCFSDGWKEQLEFSSYAGDESGRVRVGYFMNTENGMEVTEDMDGESSFWLQPDDTYPPYSLVFSDRIAEKAVQFQVDKNYLIQHTQVETKVKSADSYERNIIFTLEKTPSEEEQGRIVSRFQSLADQVSAGEIPKIISESSETGFAVTVAQKGNAMEISESSANIFGSSVSLGIARDKTLMNVVQTFGFYENFNYGNFVQKTTEDHTFSYKADLGFLNRISGKNGSEGEFDVPVIKGSTISYESADSYVDVSCSGNHINLTGILLWILIGASAGVLVYGMKKTGVFAMVKQDIAQTREQSSKKRQDRADEVVAVQQATPEQKALEEAAVTIIPPMEVTVLFCEECGHPYEDGALFCENCGNKLNAVN